MRRIFGGVALGVYGLLAQAAILTSPLLTSPAPADPLVLKHVAAEAKWLFHVDVDAMRESTVAQKMYAKAMEKHPHAKHGFDFASTILGMDPRTDLYAITGYGKVIGDEKGVLMVHAKVDREKLKAMAKKAPDSEEIEYGDYKITTWTHKKHGKEKTVAGAFYGDDWMVFASSADELKAAIDVLTGKAAGVAEDGALGGRVPKGSTVVMRIDGISEAKLECKPPIAKLVKSHRIAMGESDGQSFYRSRTTMTTEDAAEDVVAIVKGLQALGRLHVGNNEQGKKMVEALEVKRDDTTVTVLWSSPADAVWDQIELHCKLIEEMKAKHRKHREEYGHGKKKDKGEKKFEKEENSESKDDV